MIQRGIFRFARRIAKCSSPHVFLNAICLFGLIAIRGFAEQPEVLVKPVPVSIIQMRTAPAELNGRWVRVIGFGVFEFESSFLYTSRDAASFDDEANRVFVAGQFSEKGLNATNVMIVGRVRWNPSTNEVSLEEVKSINPARKFREFSGMAPE